MSATYTIVVEKDPESGWLVGEVVELPGCYTQARICLRLKQTCARQSVHISRQPIPMSRLHPSLAPGGSRFQRGTGFGWPDTVNSVRSLKPPVSFGYTAKAVTTPFEAATAVSW